MPKFFTAVIFLLILAPNPVQAEFEPPEHRWTLGYYYEDGITLRRFLGEKWEIYLGGGPDDFKSESDYSTFRINEGESPTPDQQYEDSCKSEEGFVALGVGRQLLREDRFWLTAIMGMRYHWENFQTRYRRDECETNEFRVGETVGHRMTTTVSLSLRPAYDITSRIVFYALFGINFSGTTETSDHRTDRFNNNQLTTETQRNSYNTDRAGVFGINNISSIGFMFRF